MVATGSQHFSHEKSPLKRKLNGKFQLSISASPEGSAKCCEHCSDDVTFAPSSKGLQSSLIAAPSPCFRDAFLSAACICP